MNRRRILQMLASTPAAMTASAWTQIDTSKPISLVVPFSAGSQIDMVARLYAARLATVLKRAVVVVNKPGAGGVVSSRFVAQAAPDGTTLLTSSATFLITPLVNKNAGYSPLEDFVPVSGLYSTQLALLARSKFEATTLKDFVALAKSQPRKYSYGTNGLGTYSQLLVENLASEAGIELLHVPYKGLQEASQALISGDIHLAVEAPSSAAPRVKSGLTRALVVFGDRKEPSLPDAPTASQAGFPESGKVGFFAGIVAPAKTPTAVLSVLSAASDQVLNDAGYAEALAEQGMSANAMHVDQLRQAMAAQDAIFRRVVQKLDIKI